METVGSETAREDHVAWGPTGLWTSAGARTVDLGRSLDSHLAPAVHKCHVLGPRPNGRLSPRGLSLVPNHSAPPLLRPVPVHCAAALGAWVGGRGRDSEKNKDLAVRLGVGRRPREEGRGAVPGTGV